MKNRSLSLAAAAAAVALSSAVFADPIALEGFPLNNPDGSTAYAAGNITGKLANNGVTSFGFGNNVWNGNTGNNQINTSQNNYPNYPYTSAGRFVFLGATGTVVREGWRTLSSYTPANTYYMSGLVISTSAQGTGVYTGFSTMGFTGVRPTAAADWAGGGVGAAGLMWGFNNNDLVVRYNDASVAGGVQTRVLLTNYTKNSNYWMGFKLELNTSGNLDTVNYWVDNTTGLNRTSESTLTSTALASGSFQADVVTTNADLVRLQQNSQTANATFFDEYALGTKLSDIIDLQNAWSFDGNGDWTLGTNWASGTSPSLVGDDVTFAAGLTSSPAITLNSAVSAGRMTFNSANTYSVTGTGSINLQATGSRSVAINVNAGNSIVAVPVTLGSKTTNVSVATGASLSVTSMTQAATGSTLNKTGLGTLSVGSIVVDTLNIGSTVDAGGTVVLGVDALPRSSAARVSVVKNLYISNDNGGPGNTTFYGKLDVGTSDLIVKGTDATDAANKYAAVNEAARVGQTNGGGALFGGNGITSSTAAADAATSLRFAVGVIPNSFGGAAVYDTFDGQAVTQNDVLVKFTYFGDADLSGSVDDTDFFLANNGLLNGLTGWLNGDFDYSGVVDDTDFFLLNNGFLNQGTGLRAGSGVPEPTGMGLIGLAAGALLGRRRK